MDPVVSSGAALLDEFLNGGYEAGVVTTIFGPAGSGKTTLCLMALLSVLRQKKKVIFMDTEGGFSLARLSQLAGTEELKPLLDAIILLKPTNYTEQKAIYEKLKLMANAKVGIIVVDTATTLYRIAAAEGDERQEANRILGQQMAILGELARKLDIPVIVTNQVYADFSNPEQVNMVGGDILRYRSKCLVELQKFHGSNRKAIIRQHRSLPEGRECTLRIVHAGVEGEITLP